MNANDIIKPEMSLTEKLKAIDKAMLEAQFTFNKENGREVDVPLDPGDAPEFTCLGCQ